MAKRGYRGKHPNNDKKVNTVKGGKVHPKLQREYDKTGPKHKYEYIDSHYFYPQGSGTITIGGNVGAGDIITVVSADGTSKAYVAATDEDLTVDPCAFDRNTGGAAAIATSILDCINTAGNGHGGKILCTEAAGGANGTITLTQVEPGPDGNVTITTDAASNVALTGFTGG